MPNVLVAIALLSAIIALHEFGHYLAARACGMRVTQFSLGFGPAVLRFQVAGTEWRLSAVPLGGYVFIAGKDAAQACPMDAGAFANAPAWKRAIVMLAGPAANIIPVAVILFAFRLFRGDNLGAAIATTVAVFWEIAAGTFTALSTMAHGHLEHIAGPVGIVQQAASMSTALELTAFGLLLSVSIGIFNLLPLPPLDGGELALIAAERIAGRRIGPTPELAFKLCGTVLVLVLLLATVVSDVVRWIHG